MNRHLYGCLRQFALGVCVTAGALMTASTAYSATFSYTSTVVTANGTYLGATGVYLPYTPLNSSPTTPPNVPTAITSFQFGSFQTLASSNAPNGNVVTSTFTLDINTGLPGVSSPVAFTGSVVADPKNNGQYDITFSPSSKTYFWSGDPNGPTTFDVQNVGTCNATLLGCYTVGIAPLQLGGMGKTVNLYGFISPANLTTPEPASAATMGLATVGLLIFAMRRKLQPQRS